MHAPGKFSPSQPHSAVVRQLHRLILAQLADLSLALRSLGGDDGLTTVPSRTSPKFTQEFHSAGPLRRPSLLGPS